MSKAFTITSPALISAHVIATFVSAGVSSQCPHTGSFLVWDVCMKVIEYVGQLEQVKTKCPSEFEGGQLAKINNHHHWTAIKYFLIR